jgi:hypothetical protein
MTKHYLGYLEKVPIENISECILNKGYGFAFMFKYFKT